MTSFSFVQITDHHLTKDETQLTRGFSTWSSYRAVLRHIACTLGNRIDFIVSTGDIVEPASESAYRTVLNALAADTVGAAVPGPVRVSIAGLDGMPMYFLPGNHDDALALRRVFFPATAAQERMNLRFAHKGVNFICLDWGRDACAASTPGMLDWLAAQLADDQPTVILTHHPIEPVGVRWLDQFVPPDAERFWEIVEGRNILAVLSGHFHMTTEQVVLGIPVFTLRSTAFQFARHDSPLLALEPPHYRLVAIQDGILTSRVYEVEL